MPDIHIDPASYDDLIRQHLADLHCRAGEPAPIRPLMMRLHGQLQPRELGAVLDDMAGRGLFKKDGRGNLAITEEVCPSPTADEIREILLDVVASTNPRPGDAISLSIFMARAIDQLRPAEMQGGLDALVAEGALTPGGGSYGLTEAGYRLLDL
jgi:hypothetical protein